MQLHPGAWVEFWVVVGGVAGSGRVHGTRPLLSEQAPLSKLVLIVLLREISWASFSPVSSHPPSRATPKQTRLAKVGTGEDGRFLPAGNDIKYLASFNIVCRVAPMPPGSLPVLHRSLLRRKKSLFSSVLQQCLEDLEIATYNRLVMLAASIVIKCSVKL